MNGACIGVPAALVFVVYAIRISRETGQKAGEAYTLGNIAIVYQELKEQKKALEINEEALKIYREIKDKDGEAKVLGNIAIIYSNLTDYNIALENDITALEIYKLMQNKNGEETILGNMSSIYLLQNNYPKAFEYGLQSLNISHDIGNKANEANDLCNIGNIYEKTRQYKLALNYLKNGLNESKEIGSLNMQRDAFLNISDIYSKINKPDSAFEAYKQYIILRDSILNVDKQKEIVRKQMQFDFDNKDAITKATQAKKDEITRLEIKSDVFQRNTFIAGGILLLLASVLLFGRFREERRSKKLIAIEKEKSEQLGAVKDKLFSIISHDLRSPMMTLDASLKILRREKVSQEEFNEVTGSLDSSMQSTLNLLDNLLEWSYSQIKESRISVANVNLKNIIDENIALFKNMAKQKNISLISKAEDDVVCYSDRNVMRLVLRNLTSNAIKFSKPGGKIEIDAKKNSDGTILTVQDNGIGMSVDDLPKLFQLGGIQSRQGTNKEPGTGLGLALCNELLEKCNAQFRAESVQNEGSTFFVIMPTG